MIKLFLGSIIVLNFLYALDTKSDGLYYLNKLREQSNLNELTESRTLWKSSKNHTNYLVDRNKGISHIQNEKTKMYSGNAPWDRALYTGYNNRNVSENISGGISNYKKSIDLLMTAIYHRFGFLSANIDEVGFYRNKKIITYNMGNTSFTKACKSRGKGPVRINFCDKKSRISKKEYYSLREVEQNNPKYIIFPGEESLNNMPVFYDETPDPIPDKTVTGNPVSIEFNKFHTKSVKIKSFKIFEGYKELENTRLLTMKNDPNKKLKKFQYALFPLDRLKWGKRYSAEVKAIVNGKRFEKKWDFYTKRLNGIIYNVKKPKNFEVWKNKNYFLAFDANYFGRINQFRSSCSDVSFVDYNTFKININKNCTIQVNKGLLKFKVK